MRNRIVLVVLLAGLPIALVPAQTAKKPAAGPKVGDPLVAYTPKKAVGEGGVKKCQTC